MDKPQVTVLENGMTVVTQKMQTKQVYANMAVNVGSRHESPEESGISHYLEHMLASDTERYTSEENSAVTQNMRGYSNASTNYEKTDYYYRVGAEYTEDAIQMLSDSLQSAKLNPARIDVERKAVQEEMRAAEANPQSILWEQMTATAFPGSGLDKPIGGIVEVVGDHSRDDLLNFMDKHYSADKMVLTVVGDVEHGDIVEMAQKHFDKLPSIPAEKQIQAPPVHYRGGMATRSSDETEQVSLYVGFEAAGDNDPETQAVDTVLASILGGNFSSRLMNSLRSEKGLVYSASAGTQTFSDTGLMLITAATEGKNGEEATFALCDELTKIASEGVTAEELSATKNQLLGSLERQQESVSYVGESLVDSYTVNKDYVSFDQTFDLLQKVTAEQVQERAAQIFAKAPSISAFGKGVEQLPPYEAITARLGHPRGLDASGLAVENVPGTDREAANSNIAGHPPAQQQRGVA